MGRQHFRRLLQCARLAGLLTLLVVLFPCEPGFQRAGRDRGIISAAGGLRSIVFRARMGALAQLYRTLADGTTAREPPY